MKKEEIDEKYNEIFEFAKLRKFKNIKLKNFSSGMYARLAFSTAIATNPDILLIDKFWQLVMLSFKKDVSIKLRS